MKNIKLKQVLIVVGILVAVYAVMNIWAPDQVYKAAKWLTPFITN